MSATGDDLALDAGDFKASVKSRPAPLPRPPTPMIAAFERRFGLGSDDRRGGDDRPAAASVELRMNWRRDTALDGFID